MGITEFLRGANGGLELNRLVGALGGIAYIVGAHGFIITELAMGRGFDLTAYCLAFPGGLATLGLGTAGAVAIKDRNVAAAQSKGGDVYSRNEAAGRVADAAEHEADRIQNQ